MVTLPLLPPHVVVEVTDEAVFPCQVFRVTLHVALYPILRNEDLVSVDPV